MKKIHFIVCILTMALLVPYVTIAYAESFVTTDENGKITYDLAEYAQAKFTSDTAATQTTYEGLEGLTFYDVDGGNGNSHNWWTVKKSIYGFELYPNGYIAYTPSTTGTLSVTAFSAYSNGTRRVYITDDLSNRQSVQRKQCVFHKDYLRRLRRILRFKGMAFKYRVQARDMAVQR